MIRATAVALALIAVVVIVRITQSGPDPEPPNDAAAGTVPGTVAVPGTAGDGQTVEDPSSRIPGDARPATVTSITDGDTLRVDVDGVNESVRLLELDAPEVDGDCGADDATAALRTLAPVGSQLWIEADVEGRDRFGRLLRYVYREDGTMINEAIVRGGWARARLYPPNDRYWPLMQEAQREAQDRRANLWTRCGWAAEGE